MSKGCLDAKQQNRTTRHNNDSCHGFEHQRMTERALKDGCNKQKPLNPILLFSLLSLRRRCENLPRYTLALLSCPRLPHSRHFFFW